MSMLGTPKSRFSQRGHSTNQVFTDIVFMNSGVDFSCFLEALGAVCLFFWAWKTSLETEVIEQISSLGSGEGDQRPILALKTINSKA